MHGAGQTPATWLDLYDYRRRVAASYADRARALLAGEDDAAVHVRFRAAREALFARHPQSPLPPTERASFAGLSYFPYAPELRVAAHLEPIAEEASDALPASGPHTMRFVRAARLHFTLEGTAVALIVYWIDVYGGGLFLPFRDGTTGSETYGGGRYLFDTVKGSDFLRLDAAGRPTSAEGEAGYAGGPVLLDFNYAYSPSCAYDGRWVCPLAPAENRLPQRITAGERAYAAH